MGAALIRGFGLTTLILLAGSCVLSPESSGTETGPYMCSEYCDGDTQYWCDENGDAFYWNCKDTDKASICEVIDGRTACLVPCPAGTTSYCEGNVSRFCARLQNGKDYVFSDDCSESGKSCGWVPDVCEYDCIGCGGHDPGEYWCEANVQHWCKSEKIGGESDCEKLGTTCEEYGCDVFQTFGEGAHCTNNFALNCLADGSCSWTNCTSFDAVCELSAQGAVCGSCNPALLFPYCSYGSKAVCAGGF